VSGTPRRLGPPPPGAPVRVRVVAVVVDARWRVAVVDGALPSGPGETSEAAAQAVRAATGLTIEVLHALGGAAEAVDAGEGIVDEVGWYFVGRVLAGDAGAVAWWGSTKATRELSRAADRWMVRRALGAC
jgi:hypothetical protein